MVTALHAAARSCNAEAARFLLEVARCNPRAEAAGTMPHQWAATSNCIPVLEVLLGASGVPADAEADGKPALHHAVDLGAAEAAMVLLDRGADPLWPYVDSEGREHRVSEYATHLGYPKLGRALRRREAAALAARQQARWGAVAWGALLVGALLLAQLVQLRRRRRIAPRPAASNDGGWETDLQVGLTEQRRSKQQHKKSKGKKPKRTKAGRRSQQPQQQPQQQQQDFQEEGDEEEEQEQEQQAAVGWGAADASSDREEEQEQAAAGEGGADASSDRENEAAGAKEGGAATDGGGWRVAEDDFDDGAMDFGDEDSRDGVAEEGEDDEAATVAAAGAQGGLEEKEEGGTGLEEEEPAAVGVAADRSGPVALPEGSAEPELPAPPSSPAPSSVPAPEPEPEPEPEPARPPPLKEYLDEHTPESLVCPISLHLLDDPVMLTGDGCTYSRAAIEAHLTHCRARNKPLTSPKNNLAITNPALAMLFPNVLARGMVLDFKAAATREWEEAERRWQEWAEKQQGQQG